MKNIQSKSVVIFNLHIRTCWISPRNEKNHGFAAVYVEKRELLWFFCQQARVILFWKNVKIKVGGRGYSEITVHAIIRGRGTALSRLQHIVRAHGACWLPTCAYSIPFTVSTHAISDANNNSKHIFSFWFRCERLPSDNQPTELRFASKWLQNFFIYEFLMHIPFRRNLTVACNQTSDSKIII